MVKKGDSLYSIGKKYNVSYLQIAKDNEIPVYETLVIGQTIVIKEADVTPVTISKEINAYAYPHITDNVLKKTVPYLTYLSPFAYKVNADGSLTPIDDSKMNKTASENGVYPAMVIANIEDDKGFSSELASEILNDNDVINTLLNNVKATMEQKGYKVLDLDFEYIFPSDKDAYNNFVKKAADFVHNLGYKITSALAPKTSSEQKGILYEAHDYAFHGKTVDHVILMTYEWGYTYSSPMAVAPVNEVRKVLDYAVTQIPPEKILMGIPNYGYNWKLPFTKGTAAKTVGNYEAVDLARKYNTEIQYDEKWQAPFFYYRDENNTEHVVWFEDARSVQAKLKLLSEYGLSGGSYWTINRFFPQNWLVLSSMYIVVKK